MPGPYHPISQVYYIPNDHARQAIQDIFDRITVRLEPTGQLTQPVGQPVFGSCPAQIRPQH